VEGFSINERALFEHLLEAYFFFLTGHERGVGQKTVVRVVDLELKGSRNEQPIQFIFFLVP
jgi:hypothetical protein